MAWIAVHEQVDGAKLRQLKKAIGCSKLEALGILVKLWLWGLDNADRDGELKSADRVDIAEVFAFDLSKKITPDTVVDALIKTGWIDVDGDRLFLHDWTDWQDQWYKALDKREKDKMRKRTEAEKKRAEKQEKIFDNSKEEQATIRGNSTENLSQPSPSPSPLPSPLPLPNRQDVSSAGRDAKTERVDAVTSTRAKPMRKEFGQYGWVKLDDGEYTKLLNDLGEAELLRCIAYIDESAQSTGNKNKWKDWNLVLRRCSREGWGVRVSQENAKGDVRHGSGQPNIQQSRTRPEDWCSGFHPADTEG